MYLPETCRVNTGSFTPGTYAATSSVYGDNMFLDFQKAIIHLIRAPNLFSGFRKQFDPQDHLPLSIPRNINAAFLLILSGSRLSHPARVYLDYMADDDDWGAVASSYLQAMESIESEVDRAGSENPWFAKALVDLVDNLDAGLDMSRSHAVELFHRVLYPEAVGLLDDDTEGQAEGRDQAIEALRARRTVKVEKLNPAPVTQPHREVLFTSNALFTLPLDESHEKALSPDLHEQVIPVMEEEQRHWYDHPIPLGVGSDQNEVVYGLQGLEEAVRFEIGRGTAPEDAKVPVLLSISTTHDGLGQVARDFLASELDYEVAAP